MMAWYLMALSGTYASFENAMTFPMGATTRY